MHGVSGAEYFRWNRYRQDRTLIKPVQFSFGLAFLFLIQPGGQRNKGLAAPNALVKARQGLTASWRMLDARLSSEKDGIDARASQLAAWLVEIRDADARWRQARADAQTAQAPGRVVDLAAGVLPGLRALDEKLEESRNAALDIQARIAEEAVEELVCATPPPADGS